ncbi:MAG: hypothetical protein KDB03_03050 [Planctomycetales bacterium]|nr:hypothetical protein [Planctomycetales bacterium]
MPLAANDYLISATHRIINNPVMEALAGGLRDPTNCIRIDSSERLQGLEHKLLIVVHPLSDVMRPFSFDLETDRLCVMASRHRSDLIVISRDHVPAMLDS